MKTFLILTFLFASALAGPAPGTPPGTIAGFLEESSSQLEESSSQFVWPTGSPAEVVSPFDNPGKPWLSGHRGVDLSYSEGSPIYAAQSGTVIFAGRINDRAVISIEHSDGLRTTYEPVDPTVSKGDRVKTGGQIGHLQAGHIQGSSVLHWGAKYPEDLYVDPLGLLSAVKIRLWE